MYAVEPPISDHPKCRLREIATHKRLQIIISDLTWKLFIIWKTSGWISSNWRSDALKPHHSNLYYHNDQMHVISPLQSSNSTKAAFISHHYCCITLQHTFGIWESSPSNKKATCLWVVFNHLKQKNFFHRVTLFYYAQSKMEKIISQWKLTPLQTNKNNKNTTYIKMNTK